MLTMGLTMNLYRCHTLSRGSRASDEATIAFDAVLTAIGNPVDLDPERAVLSVQHCVGSWRNAWPIHRWFVREVQGGTDDARRYPVTVAQLRSLRETCLRVLADRWMKAALLPSLPGDDGEFFGEHVRRTIDALDRVLADDDAYASFEYHGGW